MSLICQIESKSVYVPYQFKLRTILPHTLFTKCCSQSSNVTLSQHWQLPTDDMYTVLLHFTSLLISFCSSKIASSASVLQWLIIPQMQQLFSHHRLINTAVNPIIRILTKNRLLREKLLIISRKGCKMPFSNRFWAFTNLTTGLTPWRKKTCFWHNKWGTFFKLSFSNFSFVFPSFSLHCILFIFPFLPPQFISFRTLVVVMIWLERR